jgi:hypothetical protein
MTRVRPLPIDVDLREIRIVSGRSAIDDGKAIAGLNDVAIGSERFGRERNRVECERAHLRAASPYSRRRDTPPSG